MALPASDADRLSALRLGTELVTALSGYVAEQEGLDAVAARGVGAPDAVAALEGSMELSLDFFSLLMFPRSQIPEILRRFRDALVSRGYFLLAMVKEDLDYVPFVFLGNVVRVTGFPRGELRSIVAMAGFNVLDLKPYAYLSSDSGGWPEIQLFLYCRRDDPQ